MLWLLSKLPTTLLYKLSDLIAFTLENIFQYRKVIVMQNLRNSFPDRNDKALKQIAHQFYKLLSDRIIESVICIGISKEDLLKRVVVKNYSLVEDFCKQGKSVVAVLGHCGSWEMACLASSIYIDRFLKYAIYTPSRNLAFDHQLKEVRGRFGMRLISMQETPRYLRHGFGEVSVGMFLADQSHSNPKRAYWTSFLHQDTAFMTGAARFARAQNAALVFVKVTQRERGHFEIENILLEEFPDSLTDNELTEKFVRLLERQIIENPSDWLWSHRRWKHQRE